jgi:hypothetical protein
MRLKAIDDHRRRCFGIPMQVVVPSVSRAARPQGRAATMTVDSPSAPWRDSPVGENGVLSDRPGDTLDSAAGASWFEAFGEDPASGAAGAAPPAASVRAGAVPVV